MLKNILKHISAPMVDRYRTAISRNKLSSPMKTLHKLGFLNGEYSIFDYGCGKGDDLKFLELRGIKSSGFDPHFFPNNKLIPSDIVSLGFVINVIEDKNERDNVIKSAFNIAKQYLVISVMTPKAKDKFLPYKDGVLTSRNTFQKYFKNAELIEYVKSIINCEIKAVGQGIVLCKKLDSES